MKSIPYIIIGAICFVLGALFTGQVESKRHVVETIPIHDTIIAYHQLTDWQILQLAIMAVESKYESHAEGGHNAKGVFQITPIYVEECNRILGAEEYAHDDAYDLARSIEMFDIMQNYHNPGKDFQRAVKLHNPGGKAIGYPDKVIRAYNEIVKYERAREAVR